VPIQHKLCSCSALARRSALQGVWQVPEGPSCYSSRSRPAPPGWLASSARLLSG